MSSCYENSQQQLGLARLLPCCWEINENDLCDQSAKPIYTSNKLVCNPLEFYQIHILWYFTLNMNRARISIWVFRNCFHTISYKRLSLVFRKSMEMLKSMIATSGTSAAVWHSSITGRGHQLPLSYYI